MFCPSKPVLGVLYLAGSIDNLNSEVLILMPYHLAESVLDSGVVGVDEVFVNELDREGALSYCGCWLARVHDLAPCHVRDGMPLVTQTP